MTRTRVSLDGNWEFAPVDTTEMPVVLPGQAVWHNNFIVPSSWRWSMDPAAEYQPYNLFDYPPEWNSSQAGWIKRIISPEMKPGMRVWLHFEAVLQRWAFFLNGKRLYVSTESYLPVEYDLTDHLQPESNELAVWCGPYERVQTSQGEKVLAPCGSWFAGLARGPWQDVWIEYAPAVSLSDLAVRTSLRHGQIEAEITLENRTLSAFAGCLQISVFAGDQAVLTFPVQPIDLALGMMNTLRLSAAWPDPHLWSPEDPYLYHLEVVLEQNGQVVDVRRTRFGFREVWLDNHKFILNGTRVNLRGDAWHYQGFAMQTKTYALNWYHMCKDAGVNFVRLHAMPYPEFFLDAADEVGMLIVDESAIYGSGKAMQADHPIFIRNCHDHLRALVRRDRSHPSVIIWSMQNEMRWVDGRDGYRDAMPSLTETIKALDPTRPVSYDGDNRLFPPELSEIVSMHYNIDGTVASWDRTRPLIFGEHGSFHYVSPQVAARFGGPAAYLSFDEAMRALAWSEGLFNQYARREEVTGLTPFNLVNYTLRAFPAHSVRLDPSDLSSPGPHPSMLPPGSLTINNGMASDALVYVPTPAWRELAASFQPVTIFPDEYNTQFFGGTSLQRTFSIYNDTLQSKMVSFSWRWMLADLSFGKTPGAGNAEFHQPPGKRHACLIQVSLPSVEKKTNLTLSIELSHAGKVMQATQIAYTVHPTDIQPLADPARVLFLGKEDDFVTVSKYLPQSRRVEQLSHDSLLRVDVLVVGRDFPHRFEEFSALLEPFIRYGGVLLILEQSRFIPGELTWVDRTFPLVFINDPSHAVFNGLSDADLRFWDQANPWKNDAPGLTCGAFLKPAGGDMRILLEAGDGDFGWGGLLWTPLVEYTLGRGHVVCCQMALGEYAASVPQARVLLRNLLAYACSVSNRKHSPRGEQSPPSTMLFSNELVREFLAQVGVPERIGKANAHPGGVIVLDPDQLNEERVEALRVFLAVGGQVLVLPARPEHASLLTTLVGVDVRIGSAPVYQLAPTGHELARGVSVHDLYHLERVTYTPANHHNRLAAEYCLEISEGQRLFEGVQNPWKEFFVDGKDGEYQKIAVATRNIRESFQARGYAVVAPVGAGRLIFCQLLIDAGNQKTIRVYARLLGNLGAALETGLFSTVRSARDFAIDTVMALPAENYHDLSAMEAYFSDPGYTLNNLGEGVYGWMKRAERENGAIEIPASAGRIWFLSVFVESEVNRDPERRSAGELPDSSIIPDLFLEVNSACRVYVNGHKVFASEVPPDGSVKIEDVLLNKGTNRLMLVCTAGTEDVRLNLWFLNKYGDPPEGLSYRLTLD